LTDIDDQLASRFGAGFLAQIGRPCLNTRRSILKIKAEAKAVHLTDDVSEFLATHLTRDVRHIESCLHNLILRSHILNTSITLDLAREIISHYVEQNPELDLSSIIATVCRAFNITQSQLLSKSRKADYVMARNSVFYLARKHTDFSFQEIGNSLNRSHTTVIKGISSLEREIARKSPRGLQITNTLSLIEKNAVSH
jgi:chromosomal replication initiator protein